MDITESKTFHQQNQNQFIDAIVNGDLNRTKELIELGANPNERDWRGWTPLLCAVENEHLEIIKLLLVKGAEINVSSDMGYSPLHMAVDIAIDETIQSGGKQGDEPTGNILYLINAGADLNAKDRDGQTPLDWAKKYNSKKIIRLLEGLQNQA